MDRFAPLLAFIALASAMTTVVVGLVIVALRRPRAAPRGVATAHVESLRAHLADVAAERAAGTMEQDTYAQARDAIAREAVRDAPPDTPTVPPPRGVNVALAMAIPVLAIALYAWLGEPGVLQEPAFRDDMRLETLARHVAAHPDDARALTLLARELAAADRFDEAASAFERAVQSPKVARDATVWAEYADALAMAQGHTLQGRPSQLIAKALALDPRHPQALEMAGSAAFERHDYTAAAQHWRTLLAELPADSNSTDELRRALEQTERLARTTLPVSSPR